MAHARRAPARGASSLPAPDAPSRSHTDKAVIHVVGRLTDVVYSFLKPVTDSLAQSGVEQALILIDDPSHRHLLPWLDATVRIELLPDAAGPLRRLLGWQSALASCLARHPDAVVHLHGAVPSLVGATRRTTGPRYFSPHGSKSLGPLRLPGRALYFLLGAGPAGARQRVVASAGSDAARLRGLTRQPVHLIESPVEEMFFQHVPQPARWPTIVATCPEQQPRAAALFAQFAVLIGKGPAAVEFQWQGQADADSQARLNAAGVTVHPGLDTAERAVRLGSAWMLVAPVESRGFPLHVAEAMAAGVPCIVRDGPYHRDVVSDGVTGFICRTDGELVARIAELINDADRRAAMGEAGRRAALMRFDAPRFRDSVRDFYGV